MSAFNESHKTLEMFNDAPMLSVHNTTQQFKKRVFMYLFVLSFSFKYLTCDAKKIKIT